VVICFCTLGEVLLEHFLRELMITLQLPASFRDRILNANMFSKERVEKVFPSLVGEKWNAVVKELGNTSQLDYEQTGKFYRKVVKARNPFLHSGNKWIIPAGMPEECMEEIWALIHLLRGAAQSLCTALYATQKRQYRA
jgi:hypothetical protein